jgi:hypothetical protein
MLQSREYMACNLWRTIQNPHQFYRSASLGHIDQEKQGLVAKKGKGGRTVIYDNNCVPIDSMSKEQKTLKGRYFTGKVQLPKTQVEMCRILVIINNNNDLLRNALLVFDVFMFP